MRARIAAKGAGRRRRGAAPSGGAPLQAHVQRVEYDERHAELLVALGARQREALHAQPEDAEAEALARRVRSLQDRRVFFIGARPVPETTSP